MIPNLRGASGCLLAVVSPSARRVSASASRSTLQR